MKFKNFPLGQIVENIKGYRLIEAYYDADNRQIIVPCTVDENDTDHDCDLEGCSSLGHVKRFHV